MQEPVWLQLRAGEHHFKILRANRLCHCLAKAKLLISKGIGGPCSPL